MILERYNPKGVPAPAGPHFDGDPHGLGYFCSGGAGGA